MKAVITVQPSLLDPQPPAQPEQRRNTGRIVSLVILALILTGTVVVIGFVAFIAPASGATGGCGG